MDKEMLKIFKQLERQNSHIIETSDNIVPMCFIIKKDVNDKYIIDVLPLLFQNNIQNEFMINLIKSKVVKTENIVGYILFLDTKMTTINLETKQKQVFDAVMRLLYTPKEKITIMIPYKDKKILEDKITTIKGRKDNSDTWDVWNEKEISDKIQDEYFKYKKENPELYKGCPVE